MSDDGATSGHAVTDADAAHDSHAAHAADAAHDAARVRAGRAVRALGHALVGHHASTDVLDEISRTLDGFTDQLRTGERRQRDRSTFGQGWGEIPPDGAILVSYPERPASGAASPWGLDLEVRRQGDEVVASFVLGAAHEGAPDRSHGGIVAMAFDDVLGFVLTVLGQPAYTGELRIRYEAPTPLHVPLTMRARLDRRDGRKLHLSAELAHGEHRLARASAVFIAVG